MLLLLENTGVTQMEAVLEAFSIHCTKKGGERMESDVCWPFSKPEDWHWPGMNLLCPTSAPLSVQLSRGTSEKRVGKIKKSGGK